MSTCFECPYSLKVWILVTVNARMHDTPSKLEDITSWLVSVSSKRSLVSVVCRLKFLQLTSFGKRGIIVYSLQTRGRRSECVKSFSRLLEWSSYLCGSKEVPMSLRPCNIGTYLLMSRSFLFCHTSLGVFILAFPILSPSDLGFSYV